MQNFRTAFHGIAAALYIYICYWDYNLVPGEFLPIKGNFFSKFVWLTLIDLYLQTIYNIVAFFISFSTGRHPILHFAQRAIVAPVGVTVVVLFWALFLFDPDTLLADEHAKKIIAIAMYNHGIHTLPAITTVLDTIITNHGNPKKKNVLTAIGIFATLYVIDIHYVHHISGFWAYPILGNLPLPARAVFIAVCLGVIYANFLVLNVVHTLVHGSAKPQKRKIR